LADLALAGPTRSSAAAAAPSEADDEARRRAHLRLQQLALLCRQATRSPFVILIAIGFVAYAVGDHAPHWLVWAWGAALCAILFVRRAYAVRVLRSPPADATAALRTMVLFAAANGVATGAAAPLFFGSLPYADRALLTMVLVCWSAGGVATAAAYAGAFFAFIPAALGPLALLWVLGGDGYGVFLGVLIALFVLILSFFVRDNERVLRESFAIRYENERLIEELERERLEAALARDRAEDADRAKSRFLAAASHDLRQPLHALSLYAAALTLRASATGADRIAGNIREAVESLSKLVDSLLDISKLDAGAIHPEIQLTDVGTLAERIAQDFAPVAQAHGLELRARCAPALVRTDPVLLERIVRNLVDNAIKYTVRGAVAIAVEARGREVVVAVRDTGPGIPAAERERIFEEFYQIGNPERDRARGLGLGLAIVRRLARLLGCEIELDTAAGAGATFTVRMPRAAADGPAGDYRPAAGPVAADASALRGVHVLVLDDEPAVRTSMRTLLNAWGCRATVCSGLAEAERIVTGRADGIDVIVADLRLRQNESGIETVRALRGRLGEVPALLVTGDTAPERLREAAASGLPLLHKPVFADALRAALIAAVGR
jgi:signal transduction histidine kinase/CheY-like chemotaxis protein